MTERAFAAPRAIVFDLDGTLVDSHAAIAASVDHMMRVHGLQPPSQEVRELALSRPLRGMIAALTNATEPERIEAFAASYLEHYVSTMVATSNPFEGVEAMLDGLERLSVPLAVLTNKTEINAIKIVHGRFGERRFPIIVGSVPGRANKPEPEGARLVALQLGVPVQACWLIGDSELDLLTARAAGMLGVGVTWGITPTLAEKIADADVLLGQPGELTALVERSLSADRAR